MNREYSDQKQRAAICYSKWKEHTASAAYIVSLNDDELAFFDDEID